MREEDLSRRDFLERTAYTAGLAGMAGALPASTLLYHAADAEARRSQLPKPRNLPIDHFVIVMMENRSFDHYFGWLARSPTASRTRSSGTPRARRAHAAVLDWGTAGRAAASPTPATAGSPAASSSNGFLARAAATTSSRSPTTTRASSGSSTRRPRTTRSTTATSARCSPRPGRTATTSGRRSRAARPNNTPVATGRQPVGDDLRPRARPRLTANYFNSDLPFSAVWGARAGWTRPLELLPGCATGTLPNITIVDPPFHDGGGGDGLSADEHPLGDVRLGQAWMADVVRAFVDSPNYRRGALFVIYDEWGGFFDHVRPPRVPDDRSTGNFDTDFGQMGFRIPAVAVSPYSRRQGGPRCGSITRCSATSRSSS